MATDGVRDVAVFVGSLRKDSFTRKVANALKELAPSSLKLEIIEIGQLALYNQDSDANPPTPWVEFRQRVKRADAVLFVTPEYNRSVPAPLKNAIDVGSRPYGQSVWNAKPGAIVSVSPGAIGACVSGGAPSIALTSRTPCQWTAVASGNSLMRRTQTSSPRRTCRAGPGTMPS